jgi:mitochondrial enoyl-[acyl-carrier protein] reductase / trans-2-enoyl-CoA reductase
MIRSIHRTLFISKRYASSGRAIVYSSYGNPIETVKLIRYEVPEPANDQVQVKLLAAPINPADINQIEGVYPSRPEMTTDELGSSEPVAVGGNEGVFQVVKVGKDVTGIKPGDWTIPLGSNLGTWRTVGNFAADALIAIDPFGLSKVQAATVSVNPTTAFMMLSQFVKLQAGDWFIQNAGNSGVGRAAIQLGRLWGLNSISVVRDRPDIEELTKELADLGATHVMTESQLSNRSQAAAIKQWTAGVPVRLGFNGVGGPSSTNIARQLANGGHLVTYGGMSKQPVTFPTSLFIFKNITAHGFWLSRHIEQHAGEKEAAVQAILKLYRSGQFTATRVIEHIIEDGQITDEQFEGAFKRALKGYFEGGKHLIVVG